MAKNTIIVSVLANTKGLTKEFDKASGVLGKLGSVGLGATKVIAGIGATVAGLAIGGGIARALNIDEATTKLGALGYEGEKLKGVMDSALASVKGTSFGLGDAATIAAGALAAGVKEGEALTSSLTTVANTAALAGTGLGEMGSIFNKVWANGKVTTQEMNQLADRGVPIWQYLSEAFGVSNEELRKMIETGQVTADMFTGALGPAVEGVATKMGSSFRGMVANAMASLSRLGAMFVGPVLEAGKSFFTEFTILSDGVAKMLEPVAAAFAKWLESVNVEGMGQSMLDFIQQVVDKAPGILEFVNNFSPFALIVRALSPLLPPLASALGALATAIANGLLTILPELDGLLVAISGALVAVLPPVVSLITWVAQLATGLVNFVVANREVVSAIGIVAGVFAGLIAAFKLAIAIKTAFIAVTYGAQGAMLVAGTAATIYNGVMKAWTIATNIAAGAQRLFNLALAANPIGLVITAIAALVAGLVWFFTQTELGQQIWANFTQFLSEAWTNIVNFFQTGLANITSWWTDSWTNIGKFFENAWTNIKTFLAKMIVDLVLAVYKWGTDTWAKISSAWQMILDFFGSIPGRIKQFFVDAAVWLVNAGTKIITGLRDGITNFWANVVSWFRGLPGAIGGFLSGAATWLFSAGQNIIRGLIDGIGNMATWLKDKIGSVINGAVDWAKSLLGIASPSKVFRKIGQQTGQGLALGIASTEGLVKSAMAGLSEAVVGGYDAELSADSVSTILSPYSGRYTPGGDTINIEVKTLNATPAIGKMIAESLEEYKRAGGRK